MNLEESSEVKIKLSFITRALYFYTVLHLIFKFNYFYANNNPKSIALSKLNTWHFFSL